MNPLTLLFCTLVLSFIIAFTNEIIELKLFKARNKSQLIYNIYIKTLTGIAMSYITYLINANLIIVGSILGALIGSPLIIHILEKVGVNTSNISIEDSHLRLKPSSEEDSQLYLFSINETGHELADSSKLLYLMELLNIITEKESQEIILKQYSQQQQFNLGKLNKVKKTMDIFLELQPPEKKDIAKKYIEIIMELQGDKDFAKALREKRKVDNEENKKGMVIGYD